MSSFCTIPIIVGDVVSACWKCIALHASYGCKLAENVRVLKNEWDELNRMKNDVKTKIDVEEGPEMRRLEKVQGWILRVEDLETQVIELIDVATDDIAMPCCCGYRAGNCKARYKFGKEVAKKIKEVSDLTTKGDFSIVVDKIPYPRWSTRYSEPTVGLETTFDEAWRYIDDDQVGVIGLYGIGGVGKTTLLTMINNKLSIAPHAFDVIIWGLVSKYPNLEKLQEDIGKQIGYRDAMWTNKSQDDKAADIFRVLSGKKFVLLLDDIWERFDLRKVGIPRPNIENKSKVIFTTRSEVVCGRMGGKKVRVKCLALEEALDLFTQNVGEDTLNADPEIRDLAMLVVKKCGGLPLALITIGSAMSCKNTHQEWHSAISLLEGNTAKFKGMEEEVFSLLKFSYDSLPSNQVRSCFLYCSLFPGDSHIPKHKLIGYWFGEGFLDEYNDRNSAMLVVGYDVIGTLVHSCLLDADENGDIKMHDVIRDMALWIASKDKILVQAGTGLTNVSTLEWKFKIERLSLMGNHIEEFEVPLPCDYLLTLLLNDNRLNMIGNHFFWPMQSLRVLDLSGNQDLTELPNDIGYLVSLEYLNISGTGITKLPVEMSKLENLRYLDLTYTYYLRTIPDEVISCGFRKLEVLKMIGCGSSDLFKNKRSFWYQQICLCNKLAYVNDLHDLSITIHDPYVLELLSWSKMLQRCTRRLGLSHINVELDDFIFSMIILERLEIVDCVLEPEELFPTIREKSRLLSLRSVFVVRCSMVNNLAWLIHAKNLEILLIAYCAEMQVIIDDYYKENYYTIVPFSRLKELYLIELPQLHHVHLSDGYGLPFPCLKYIGVEGCPKLKDLGLNSESAKGCGLTIQGEEDWWDNLKSKYGASFCLINPSEGSSKKGESSTSTSTYSADHYLPHFKSFE